MKKVLQHESMNTWFPAKGKPFIISGPCSAETEEQTVATAKQIAATGKVHALRAGIWKPRTRPGQYEGAGAEGFIRVSLKLEVRLPAATTRQRPGARRLLPRRSFQGGMIRLALATESLRPREEP